jgi:hypothetical protein
MADAADLSRADSAIGKRRAISVSGEHALTQIIHLRRSLINVGKSQSVEIMVSLMWLTCAVAAASARRADSRMRRWRLRAACPQPGSLLAMNYITSRRCMHGS